MSQRTILIPAGYALTLITDASTTGYYFCINNPGDDPTDYHVLTASNTAIAGPFNTPKNYAFDSTGGGLTYSVDQSGVFTAVDESGGTTALALKAPLASPTFTGTVVLPSTTSIGTTTATELGYVHGVTSAIQTQLDAKASSSSATSITATGGTTTLTSISAQTQIVNGTTFQIIQMPNTSTLTLGQKFIIINNTSTTTYGSVINDSTSTFMLDCLPGIQYELTCTSTSDTTFTGWDIVALTSSLTLLLNYSNVVYTPAFPISINLATAVSVSLTSLSFPVNGKNYFNILNYATNGVAFVGNVALDYGNVQSTGTLPAGSSVSWTSLTGSQLITASNVNFNNATLSTVSVPKLAYITGTLTLGTTSFSTLTLSSLVILGALTINSTSLTSFSFANAQSIQGAFTVTSGTALTTINLPSVTFVGGAISGTAVALTSFVLTNLSYILGAFSLTAALLTALSLPSLIQIGGAWSTTMALVTTATFTSLQTVVGAVTASFAALATLTFPAIVSFGAAVTFTAANMTTFSFGSTLKTVGGNFTLSGAKLDQASVNGILVSLAALDGTNGTTAYSSKTINISGGTSAAPSGAGATAKTTLQGRGCTVTTN